ncbi:UNVERIFIED_ORG: DNA-binding response OmpR family regulator [Arthrobacter globiformis]|nr:DNA-binding response OmpR family regulator [Arthrobacter globiformis]
MGFTVHAQATGAAGLRAAGKMELAFITLDIDRLPDLNALEVAKGIRALSTAPLLALTSWRAPDDDLPGLDATADAYLIKPFSPERFRESAQALCLKNASPTQTPGDPPALRTPEAKRELSDEQ